MTDNQPREGWEELWMAFAPEYGKWKIDRNIAKVFIRSLLSQTRQVVAKEAIELYQSKLKDEQGGLLHNGHFTDEVKEEVLKSHYNITE